MGKLTTFMLLPVVVVALVLESEVDHTIPPKKLLVTMDTHATLGYTLNSIAPYSFLVFGITQMN